MTLDLLSGGRFDQVELTALVQIGEITGDRAAVIDLMPPALERGSLLESSNSIGRSESS